MSLLSFIHLRARACQFEEWEGEGWTDSKKPPTFSFRTAAVSGSIAVCASSSGKLTVPAPVSFELEGRDAG
jgi:hypothetical protein